jgi:cytochrome c556
VASISNIANIIFRHEFQDAGFTAGMTAGAAAAEKAAAAGERVAGATGKVQAEVTRALPAWQSINKLTDENAKLAAATERANNKLQAQLAALRLEASKNAEVAAGQAETERRLTALRDAAVSKAALQAEQERARWAGVTNGAANAAGSFGTLSPRGGLAPGSSCRTWLCRPKWARARSPSSRSRARSSSAGSAPAVRWQVRRWQSAPWRWPRSASPAT